MGHPTHQLVRDYALDVSLRGFKVALLAVAIAALNVAPTSADEQAIRPGAVEAEVRENVLAQRVGLGTLADFALPADFVWRIVDHVVRATYWERHHRVLGPEPVTPNRASASDSDSSPARVDTRKIRVHKPESSDAIKSYRHALRSGRPGLRGFRAPILTHRARRPAIDLSPLAGPETVRAAEIVARRLARDGLLPTLVRVMHTLGPTRFTHEDAAALDTLWDVGFPVDLLECFAQPNSTDGNTADLIRDIATRLKNGEKIESLIERVSARKFHWPAADKGFRVCTESGEHAPTVVRLQLMKTAGFKHVNGDGGSFDIARQLMRSLPDAEFVATINESHVKDFMRNIRDWKGVNAAHITLITTDLPIAQWAQDNGKGGLIQDAQSKRSHAAFLAPRYANRRNDGSEFLPNDSFAMDGLAAAGVRVVQSKLLFQGGNILAYRDPADDKPKLLIGEAELHRNTVMGLTTDQVIEAFRVEFGVARVVVLDTVSFHLDVEFTLRAINGKIVAFMHDTDKAARIIIECGLTALHRAGLMNDEAYHAAKNHLANSEAAQCINVIATSMQENGGWPGGYPRVLADAFEGGPTDSGAGNLQRFLIAMDWLASRVMDPQNLPEDPHVQAYLRSIWRLEAERKVLARKLANLGFEIAYVPSLGAAEYGINYVNGLQTRSAYFMPAHGGVFAPLDAAAREAFQGAIGAQALVLPVLCAESQRRGGAIHCSASVSCHNSN